MTNRPHTAHAYGALVWHFVLAAALVTVFLVSLAADVSTRALSIGGSVVWMSLVLITYRIDITNVFVLFSIPWVLILVSTVLPVSSYTRPIGSSTVAAVIACALTVFALTPPSRSNRFDRLPFAERNFELVKAKSFSNFGWVLIALTGLNVAFAGFVPITSLFATGNSRYMEFGLPGFYGFYNAYANAFGVMAFYLFLTTGRRRYLAAMAGCIFIFACFFSRQNAVSLVFECFIIQCLVRRRPSFKAVILSLSVVATLFSIAGNARIGEQSIYELASIDEEFRWIPEPIVWLYSYSYFNILNLDNLIRSNAGPLLNGSSVLTLFPSFLRPTSELTFETIEARQFNVTSFIDPIFRDLGIGGVLTILALICSVTQYFWRRADSRRTSFFSLASYSVLAFCFCFSFFVNFWFYLPIIAQLLFFKLFSVTVFNVRRRQSWRAITTELVA